ncbi:hypothetical protein ILUMI_04568 [Ignelater luminosus]|uniref:Btz domain-containing protein n=1 Tax=Ignelater luminosus TaxID=2038154 RepID=A0A8K0GL15_IGNLU|nr:hypothetical protein ILUMI_04568 [Ignelater luminosus]
MHNRFRCLVGELTQEVPLLLSCLFLVEDCVKSLSDPAREAEQDRLLRLLREVEEEEDPLDEESDPEEDNVKKRTEETDTEQERDSEEKCAERPLKVPRMSAFFGKDRRTTWNKHNIPNEKARTQKCNIVTPLRGVRPCVKNASCLIDKLAEECKTTWAGGSRNGE